jgi:8-oxo-dGTP diphosphatase
VRGRRIGAYGICRDGDGRVLLMVESDGWWHLPGGGIEHGEHPFDALHREVHEETGLDIEIDRLRDAVTDVIGDGVVEMHTDRLLFDVSARGGVLRPEVGAVGHGGSVPPRWVGPDELTGLRLAPATARTLGQPAEPDGYRPHLHLEEPSADRVQRFGAYGFVTDPAGRVLLTRIADGYPGAGQWHLPGGGTDFGETPTACLLRELREEGDQDGRVTGLIGLSNGHNPAAVGPEGRPVDWHIVRVHYRVVVEVPTRARVTEAAGGSTAEAGWFFPPDLRGLRMTSVAAAVTSEQLG